MYCGFKKGDCLSLDIADKKRKEYNNKIRSFLIKQIFEKIDKYSKIKDEKWYKEYKKKYGM